MQHEKKFSHAFKSRFDVFAMSMSTAVVVIRLHKRNRLQKKKIYSLLNGHRSCVRFPLVMLIEIERLHCKEGTTCWNRLKNWFY